MGWKIERKLTELVNDKGYEPSYLVSIDVDCRRHWIVDAQLKMENNSLDQNVQNIQYDIA